VATSKPDALGKAEDVAAAAIKTARPGLP